MIQQIEWAVVLAEYDEFCADLYSGLSTMKSLPSTYMRSQAQFYLGMSVEDAKRTFRSRFYCREPIRAKDEWGAEPDAPLLARRWPDHLATTPALSDFNGTTYSRILIRFAQKYCEHRKTLSHAEALSRAFGVMHPEVDEKCLRELASIVLAPARLILKGLRFRSDRFQPFEAEDSKDKSTLRLTGVMKSMEWTLRFIVEDRIQGGVTCHMYVRGDSMEPVNQITIPIANPPWDIVTLKSIEYDLDCLARLTRMYMDAVLNSPSSLSH